MSVDPLDRQDPLEWLDLLVSLVARYEKNTSVYRLFAYFI